MEIKQIKELLANEDVKRILAEQVDKAVQTEKEALLEAKSKLEEQIRSNNKEFFILKKTVLAKSNLYEEKLQKFYESKFIDAKKKLGKDVFEYINEAVSTLTKAIEEDKKAISTSSKLQEAFSEAVRIMSPFMNINELVESNNSTINELKNKINKLTKQNKELEEKAFVGGDLHTLVMKECAGYDANSVGIIYDLVRKQLPKSLVEGKEAIENAKKALKDREDALKQAQLEENKVVKPEVVLDEVKQENSNPRTKLKLVIENTNARKATGTAPESKSGINAATAGYDILNF